jgi:hypothetical protein
MWGRGPVDRDDSLDIQRSPMVETRHVRGTFFLEKRSTLECGEVDQRQGPLGIVEVIYHAGVLHHSFDSPTVVL